jgi:hypothetical protein
MDARGERAVAERPPMDPRMREDDGFGALDPRLREDDGVGGVDPRMREDDGVSPSFLRRQESIPVSHILEQTQTMLFYLFY